MRGLVAAVPDVDVLLGLAPEELGLRMLGLAQESHERTFWPYSTDHLFDAHNGPVYPAQRRGEVGMALAEAWAWLMAEGLFVPQPGVNGQNGHMIISRRGLALRDPAARQDFTVARMLPRDLLHQDIRDVVWRAFLRAEFDVAVFQAMKQVEVSVRAAGGYGEGTLGVDLARRAFHPQNGPLTDLAVEAGEREARMALFAGTLGAYKNPQSHRHVPLTDPVEAVEQVMLASHLLRIVEARVAARGGQ